ncbi:MAG: hypothetical protein ABJL57_16145 [Hyphomonas sp.]|uniref:hypothetical protein n=1 Tax=Hyphomonas sp. TaxID=87 RepID=UPI0032677DCF
MFESMNLKIGRAKAHVRELEVLFETFARENKPRLVVDKHEGMHRFRAAAEKIPDDFGLILGDAIHNLRSALDHLMWEFLGSTIDNGTQNKHTKLIAHPTKTAYDGFCCGILTPRADTKAFFKSLEIFPGGNGDAIYTLHDLDIADKHKVLTPVVGVAQITRFEASLTTGGTITVGGGGGRVDNDGYAEFLQIGMPIDKIEVHGEPTFEAVFGEVDRVSGKPIIPTLLHFTQSVERVRTDAIDFVNTRHP